MARLMIRDTVTRWMHQRGVRAVETAKRDVEIEAMNARLKEALTGVRKPVLRVKEGGGPAANKTRETVGGETPSSSYPLNGRAFWALLGSADYPRRS
jgi:hypothetical protein